MNQKETDIKAQKQSRIDELKRELQLMQNSVAVYKNSIAELESDICTHVYDFHDDAESSIYCFRWNFEGGIQPTRQDLLLRR